MQMGVNRLGSEKSPYLLQHKDNPVHWYAWGAEALEAARREDKPIFLSIGYSTCYWCHVMEKDSFELDEVAEVLNQHFISIKVDREERPDVDHIYMDAVVGMTGHGGWPMSVALTPEGKPFWGGTFFYRQQFVQILQRLHELWSTEREKILASAAHIAAHLNSRNAEAEGGEVGDDLLRRAFFQYHSAFDAAYGGFGGAPKFPPSAQVSLLLRIAARSGNAQALAIATETLDRMAEGGIFDQIGGGFHRYSVDERWLVPHFEKMLYDNALLVPAYLEAYQLTKKDRYAMVVRETLEYVLREMRDANGGFYSAQDAGEVGKEGEYYVWDETELARVLGSDELQTFADIYDLPQGGNFEHGKLVLSRKRHATADVRSLTEKLLRERVTRVPPHLDDKILTGWNGLMIAAFAKGYQVLGEEKYLRVAQESASFIKQHLWQSENLLRRYRAGEAAHEACADDYSYLICGLLELFESDWDPQWLAFAEALQRKFDEKFWDAQHGGYFYSTAPELVVQKKEFLDNATPASNAMALQNSGRLFSLTGTLAYREREKELQAIFAAWVDRYPTAFPKSLAALADALAGRRELVVVLPRGVRLDDKCERNLRETFRPWLSVIATEEGSELMQSLPICHGRTALEGKPTFYVCEEGSCQAPTVNFERARGFIDERRTLLLE